MSLNNIILNEQLLAQLYANTLLEIEAAPSVAAPQAQTADRIASGPAKPEKRTVEKTAAVLPAQPAGHALATIGTTPASTPVTPLSEYGNTPSLGSNQKGILILVSNESVPFLPDAELEFLSTILGACKLGIADVAIVNLQRHPQPYTDLANQFQSRQVLLFGITPQQIDLPFNFPHFQLQNFDGRTYLSAFPLSEIAQNRDLKMQLWGCLKTLFCI